MIMYIGMLYIIYKGVEIISIMQIVNMRKNTSKKGKYFIMGAMVFIVVVLVAAIFYIQLDKKERVVGNDISLNSITDFYYTDSTSTNPPKYQRYRFYVDEGTYKFYHEKREGDAWPLTESYITQSGTIDLTNEQWNEFLNYLNNGIVNKRNPKLETESTILSLYIYWNGDKGKYQVFSFESLNEKNVFLEYCENLISSQ